MDLAFEFPLDLEASKRVEEGFGVVCVCDDYVVITETWWSNVAVYDTATLELVSRFGSRGHSRGQFSFICYSFAGLCAAPGATNVFVADVGNARVSEHRIPSGDCVRCLGLTHVRGPRGVDANTCHVVVSDCDDARSRVLLFSCNAVDDAPPLWIFGGTHGQSLQQLNYPSGLRLCSDGAAIYVADSWNNRVVKIQMNSGSDAVVASGAHRLKCPMDVMQCSDGDLIVANSDEHRLVKVAHDNTVTRFDCGDGRFGRCLGLAFSASNGVFIVRDAQRLELFNVRWTRPRAAWIVACA